MNLYSPSKRRSAKANFQSFMSKRKPSQPSASSGQKSHVNYSNPRKPLTLESKVHSLLYQNKKESFRGSFRENFKCSFRSENQNLSPNKGSSQVSNQLTNLVFNPSATKNGQKLNAPGFLSPHETLNIDTQIEEPRKKEKITFSRKSLQKSIGFLLKDKHQPSKPLAFGKAGNLQKTAQNLSANVSFLESSRRSKLAAGRGSRARGQTDAQLGHDQRNRESSNKNRRSNEHSFVQQPDKCAISRAKIIDLMKGYSRSFVQKKTTSVSESQSLLQNTKIDESAHEPADISDHIAIIAESPELPGKAVTEQQEQAMARSPKVRSRPATTSTQLTNTSTAFNLFSRKNRSSFSFRLQNHPKQSSVCPSGAKSRLSNSFHGGSVPNQKKCTFIEQKVIIEENSESEQANFTPSIHHENPSKVPLLSKPPTSFYANQRKRPQLFQNIFKRQNIKNLCHPVKTRAADLSTQKLNKPFFAVPRLSSLRSNPSTSGHNLYSSQYLPQSIHLVQTISKVKKHNLKTLSFLEQDEAVFEKSLTDKSIDNSLMIPRYKDLIRDLQSLINNNNLLLESKFFFYVIEKEIDKGAYGRVFLGRSVLTNERVAIKCFEIDGPEGPQNLAQIQEELAAMRGLKHNNVVKLLDCFKTRHFYFLVLEWAPHGNLLSHIQQKGIFEEEEFIPVLTQIVNGLLYLRAKRVLHRDIKLENILIGADFRIKICDFGISKRVDGTTKITEHIGTPAYIAPEVILEEGYADFKVDVWSLGVLSFIALTGEIPFDGNSIEELRYNILRQDFAFPNDVFLTERMRVLLSNMLEKEPIKRFSIGEVANALEIDATLIEFEDEGVDLCKAQKIVKLGFTERVVQGHLQRESPNHIKALYELV